MKNRKPLLSLCIPTNGITEWVFPVLDNIYQQNVDENLFEIIVTNNGNDCSFHKDILLYSKKHNNLIYKKTKAYMFQNQIEALKIANGEFLKFVNHRSIFLPDKINWMIDVIKNNIKTKPVIYFSNGALKKNNTIIYNGFDEFVCGLGRYASWTTGVGVWREDFDKIPQYHIYNSISPHSDILFAEKNKKEYIIYDQRWSYDIDSSHKNKGSYDLYKAFCMDEIAITFDLLIKEYITKETFDVVKKDYKKCIIEFYRMFNILRKPCSYNIDNFSKYCNVFFIKNEIIIKAYLSLPFYLTKMFAKKIF